MKNDIGYAVITTGEYKEILEDNINKANCIKKLNEVAFKRENIYDRLEKYFFDRLSDKENYHLENMKECKPTDYHYQQLYKCFLEIGINDIQYIDLSIASLKHNFDNKKIKENNNGN